MFRQLRKMPHEDREGGGVAELRSPLAGALVIVRYILGGILSFLNVPAACKLYVRDGSAHAYVRAATLRQNL